jgi:hypothetical protein
VPLLGDRTDFIGILVYFGSDGLVAWVGTKYRTLWFAAERQMLDLRQSEVDLRRNFEDASRMHRIAPGCCMPATCRNC